MCPSKWEFEDESLKIHLNPSVLENLIQDFRLQGSESVHLSGDLDWRLSPTTARVILSNLERVRLIKPQVKELYYVVCKYSKFITAKSGEDVVSFISLLLENLNDAVREQIESLGENVRFLRNFLCFVMKRCTNLEKQGDLFTFAETIVVRASCLLYFCLVNNRIDDNKVLDLKTENFNLARKIKPLKPEIKLMYAAALKDSSASELDAPMMMDEFDLGLVDSLVDNLRELLNNTSFKFAAEDPRGILLDELKFMRDNLLDPPLCASFSKEFNALMIHTEALIIETGYIVFSGAEQSLLVSDMLKLIEHIKNEARDCHDKLIPKAWQSHFPKTNVLGSTTFIIKNPKEQQHCKAASIKFFTLQTKAVNEELVALREDFNEIVELCIENEKLISLFTHYKDVAYQTEYFGDLSVCGEVSLHCLKVVYFNLREEIRHIHKEVKAIIDDTIVHTRSKGPRSPALSQATRPSIDSVVSSEGEMGDNQDEATNQLVGLENEAKEIIERLARGSKQLKILSIVGMPGIGKTTLSKNVYNDPSVTLFFHVRAWCCVSQVYRREALLSEILHQITGQSNASREMDAYYLAHEVYKSLKGKRYLVVLDDIWAIEAWNVLKESFRSEDNGSRIVFTTRHRAVALQANSVPYDLRLLTDEESWKLLQVKVFKGETCPPELLQVGKRIAENCKGLPLSVVLIPGLLKMTEKKKNSWEKVAKRSRSREIDNTRDQHLSILELSYKHLPDYLKPCFLYFVAFPEGREIPVSKLVRLWIAEGFVQQSEKDQNSLEEEANKYLNDLIDTSLVMVAKRSSRGGIKACSIHDLLRDFCLAKAKEERFLLQIVNRYDRISSFTESDLGEQYRLYIYSNRIPSVRMGHIESSARTLLFWESRDTYHNSYSTSEDPELECYELLDGVDILFKFRLLRVLELKVINVEAESLFFNVILLNHLRYLAIRACTRVIPSEIANLINLETFILKGTVCDVFLSRIIWKMESLRQVHFNKDANIVFPSEEQVSESFAECSRLDSLRTISTVVLYVEDVEKIMRKLPCLQKLRCKILNSEDYSLNYKPFPALNFLNHLESLKLSFSGKAQYNVSSVSHQTSRN